MKRKFSVLVLLFLVSLFTGCAVFNGGCKCPKVSYRAYPQG